MDTSLNTFKQILRQEIGLDATTVGEATIRKILGQRMRACKLETIEDYNQLLLINTAEVANLIETAVIPETWFFRDIRPFSFILSGMEKNTQHYYKTPCNILSIPCSTGEEPYSLAMYLLQSGIAESNFRITAVDISQRALEIAKQGSYGKNSFRGQINQNYLVKYFQQQQDQFIIAERVSRCVKFTRVNLLDDSALPGAQEYDFILCRNLLIYFDITTKLNAFQKFHKLLKNDGMLFIGHSEFGAVPRELFSNLGSEYAYGLVKKLYQLPKAEKPAIIFTPVVSVNCPPVVPTVSKKILRPVIPTPIQETVPHHELDNQNQTCADNLLEQAQQLADQGKLKDAEVCCMRHIKALGEQCESLFLLALINESSGQKQMAESFYRKSLYLDPKHYPSLVHLALLLERNGDKKAGQLLRQRADRATKK